jgi:hypothetical protein
VKYAVEMGPGVMIYIASYKKTGSSIRKLVRRIYIQAHTDTQTEKRFTHWHNKKINVGL